MPSYWHHVKYRICYVILHGMFYQVSYGIILLLTPKVVHMSTNIAGNLQTFILRKIYNSFKHFTVFFGTTHVQKAIDIHLSFTKRL